MKGLHKVTLLLFSTILTPIFAGRDNALQELEELSKRSNVNAEPTRTYEYWLKHGQEDQFKDSFPLLNNKIAAQKKINKHLYEVMQQLKDADENTLLIIPYGISSLLANIIASKKLEFDFRYYGISFHTLFHNEKQIISIINKKADEAFDSLSDFQEFLKDGDFTKPLIIGIEQGINFCEKEKMSARMDELCKIIKEYAPQNVIIPVWVYKESDTQFLGNKEDRSKYQNIIDLVQENNQLELLIKFLDDNNIPTNVVPATFVA